MTKPFIEEKMIRNTLVGDCNGPIYRLGWYMDPKTGGSYLMTSSQDGFLRTWDPETRSEIHTAANSQPPPNTPKRRRITTNQVRLVAWSSDGAYAATDSKLQVGSVAVYGMDNGRLIGTRPIHDEKILCMHWQDALDHQGRMQRYLATGSDDFTACVSNPLNGNLLARFHVDNDVSSVALSPSGTYLAVGTGASRSGQRNVLIYEVVGNSRRPITRLKGHAGKVTSIVWWPDGSKLAYAATDNTIHVWNMTEGYRMMVLRGHTKSPISLTVSGNGEVLASAGEDQTVRFWSEPKKFKLVYIHPDQKGNYDRTISFHPTKPVLALPSDQRNLYIMNLDFRMLHLSEPQIPITYYQTAKVVVLGEQGVGKTTLCRVMHDKDVELTHEAGTNGIDVRLLKTNFDEANQTRQDVFLWDMAGQLNYRLTHQLFLNDVDVAILAFHRSMTEFESVKYWSRIIDKVNKNKTNTNRPLDDLIRGNGPMSKYLVQTRMDQDRGPYTEDKLRQIAEDLGCEQQVFRVSSYEREQNKHHSIEKLTYTVIDAVQWGSIAENVSNAMFDNIQNFIRQRKESEAYENTTTFYQLYSELALQHLDDFVAEFGEEAANNLMEQFRTCITFLEVQGLVQRLTLGNLVLLAPELLSFYATQLINMALVEDQDRTNKGFKQGRLPTQQLLSGELPIATSKRVKNPYQEKLLIIATVHSLLEHDIAMLEEDFLIFPSALLADPNDDFEQPPLEYLTYEFSGSVDNIYAVIVAHLSRSRYFTREQIARDKVLFRAGERGFCGIEFSSDFRGRAKLTIHYDQNVEMDYLKLFDLLIWLDLDDASIDDEVVRNHAYYCTNCFKVRFTNEQVKMVMDLFPAGTSEPATIFCPLCGRETVLTPPYLPEDLRHQEPFRKICLDIHQHSIEERQQSIRYFLRKSKEDIGYYDAYFWYDEDAVMRGCVLDVLRKVDDQMSYRGITTLGIAETLNPEEAAFRAQAIVFFIDAQTKLRRVEPYVRMCREQGRPFVYILIDTEVTEAILRERDVTETLMVYCKDGQIYGLGGDALDKLETALTGKMF